MFINATRRPLANKNRWGATFGITIAILLLDTQKNDISITLMKRDFPDIPMVLVAEPEEVIRESIQMILIEEGYDCHAVTNIQSLIQAISIHNSHLIIADVHIVYDNVQDILKVQNRYNDFPPFLVTLNYEQVQHMLGLMKYGITEYMIKPFSFEELFERIQKIITPKPNTPI